MCSVKGIFRDGIRYFLVGNKREASNHFRVFTRGSSANWHPRGQFHPEPVPTSSLITGPWLSQPEEEEVAALPGPVRMKSALLKSRVLSVIFRIFSNTSKSKTRLPSLPLNLISAPCLSFKLFKIATPFFRPISYLHYAQETRRRLAPVCCA